MSGAGRQKGDVRDDVFLTEDKVTDAASYRIERTTLEKITAEALHTPPGLVPRMRITIQGQTWWLIRELDGLDLLQ